MPPEQDPEAGHEEGTRANLDACADLVERADPDRFLSLMAAPIEARLKLCPIFAFNVEISRAPWVTEEPMIAEMRLQWWRDAVEEIGGAGPGAGQVRAHEVTHPLRDVVRGAGISTQMLDQMVAARRWDIYKDAFEGRAHFDDYIDQSSGHLVWASAQALGAEAALEAGIRRFAYGVGIANLLRAAAELDARGRKPLLDGTHAGITALATDALARMDSVGSVPKRIAPALWPGWQAKALLKMAIAEPARVADGALQLSGFTRHTRLLWRQWTGAV